MLLYNDIIRDTNNNDLLRTKSSDVELPISDEDLNTLFLMNEYLMHSNDDEFMETHDIRPGVGIAAPQIGVLKKMFCIATEDENDVFHNYCIVNPKIISHSEEMIYLPGGEGCLSVNDEHKGYIHRYKRIKARVWLYNFKKKRLENKVLELQGYLAIVFQHEYDHLFGKLFYDRINKENPFFIPSNSHSAFK